MRRRTWRFAVGACAAATLAAVASASISAGATRSAPPARSLGSLTTYAYGNDRSGHDLVDPPIKRLSIIPAWDVSMDGAVYGEPLIYKGMVYAATENDSIYAVDAKTGAVAWKLHVGSAVPVTTVRLAPTIGATSTCGDIFQLGITSTPVIDTKTDELFVVEEAFFPTHSQWKDIVFRLVAVSLRTPHPRQPLWIRTIDPPHANHRSTYYIPAEQQHPALTLLGSRIYVEFGGLAGNCGQYHGFVVSAPITSPRGALRVYEVPSAREGGIWETGGAFVSRAGNLYLTTGSGSSDSAADFDEGNSVLELSPTLHRLGVWAPGDWVRLNHHHWDLGSASPISVPDSSLLFAAGEATGNRSLGDLMYERHLRGVGRGAFTAKVCASGGVFGSDASDVIGKGRSAKVYVYVPCSNGTQALVVDVRSKRFTRAWTPSRGSPDGPPIVAGGVVWVLAWNNAQLFGLSPTTGRVLFQRDADAQVNFATPSVGDGLVIIPTQDGVQAWSTST
jgi:hypothetical protein